VRKGADQSTANAKALYDRWEKADAYYRVQVVRLDSVATAPPVANANLKQIAKAVAFATGYKEERIVEAILLYLPYALAILTEFGAILSLNYGLSAPTAPVPSGRRVPSPDVVTIADIAKELGISANVARGILRAKKVRKPTQDGWAWPAQEVDGIKQLLADPVVVPFARRA
jgi:hypothetical protein